MDFYALILGKDKPGALQGKEGDIIDIMPITTQWAPNNVETKMCLIVPISVDTIEQAMSLKKPGMFLKRDYKIPLKEINKIKSINMSDVRDDKKYYQPLLKDQPINLKLKKIIKDKNNIEVIL